jgi:hypothetical protein
MSLGIDSNNTNRDKRCSSPSTASINLAPSIELFNINQINIHPGNEMPNLHQGIVTSFF